MVDAGQTPPSGALETASREPRASALEGELARVESGRWMRRVGVVVAVASVIGALVAYRTKTRPPPPARYVSAPIGHGDVIETVQSTGQVKPTTEVQVGAQVSGRITKVYVDYNSRVARGDVLAEIDPTLFGAQLDSTRAQIAAAEANVKRAEATVLAAKLRLDRAQKAAREGIGPMAEVDAAQGGYDVGLADIVAAKAAVDQLQAQLRSSNTNLAYTRIISPIDGMVISRSIDPGQTVAASFQAPVLFVIAEDLRKMRVLADIDEADVGKLKEGIPSDISVDAFPGETFHGKVAQVRYSATNVSGVVTYAAVIEVENPDVKLRPGMTATVTIHTSEARGVTTIPNSALRFRPSPPVDKDGKKLPQDPLPVLAPHTGRIYALTSEKPGGETIEPRVIDLGITDGVNTATTSSLGDFKLVTDETDEAAGKKNKGPRFF